jgi:hypothetical protein
MPHFAARLSHGVVKIMTASSTRPRAASSSAVHGTVQVQAVSTIKSGRLKRR